MSEKRIKVEDRMTNEQKLISRISDFISLNIKKILIVVTCLFVALLVIMIISSVSSNAREKELVRVSELEDKVSLTVSSGEGIDELIADLQACVKDSSYSSQKAQYLIGIIYSGMKEDAKAYDAFMACLKINPKLYLAQLSLLNAAVSKDNLGEFGEAIELYNQLVGTDNIGLSSRALFNIGRIYYQGGKADLARSTFQNLIDAYPESELSKIAKNLVDMM